MVREYLVWEKWNGRFFRHEWRRYEPVLVGGGGGLIADHVAGTESAPLRAKGAPPTGNG
jgi:hypothetical protein